MPLEVNEMTRSCAVPSRNPGGERWVRFQSISGQVGITIRKRYTRQIMALISVNCLEAGIIGKSVTLT